MNRRFLAQVITVLLCQTLAQSAFAKQDRENAKASDKRVPVRLTRGIHLHLPSPFIGGGGRLGLSFANDIAEIGATGMLLWFPESYKAVGASIGAYAQIAPIPIRKGKRFYLHGRLYRAFAKGTPTFDAWGAGGGIGYRHPLSVIARSQYVFFEIGAERAYLLKYKEALYLLDIITLGIAW